MEANSVTASVKNNFLILMLLIQFILNSNRVQSYKNQHYNTIPNNNDFKPKDSQKH